MPSSMEISSSAHPLVTPCYSGTGLDGSVLVV